MKAITAGRPGGPEVLECVDIEEPVTQIGEVKIRVKAFGLNKVEGYYRSGDFGRLRPDQVLGIEAVGEIIEDRCGRFQIGQKAVAVMGGMMFTRQGSYAEYLTLNASNVLALDSTLAYEQLATLPEAYLTVWGALDKNLQIAEGESLLVRGGTSSVGMAAVSYAKARGLTVAATTRKPGSVDRLKSLGADYVLIDDGEISGQLKEIFPEGVNNALELVGAVTLKDTLNSIHHWGQVVVVGILGGSPILETFNLLDDLPNTVRLSYFGSGMLGSDELPLNNSPLEWIAKMIENGSIPSILAKSFEMDDIQEAHSLLDSGMANGKIVVTI